MAINTTKMVAVAGRKNIGRNRMWKTIALVALAGWLPCSAVASESAAEIKGLLEGDSREWFVLSHGNDSNASFIESGDDIKIDITGFVDDDEWETQESLVIGLTIHEEQLISAVILHPIGASTSPPLYTSEGAEVTVTLTQYDRDRGRIHIAGRIEGELALQVRLDEPPSQEENINIDVAFDVEAQKIEF